MAAIYDMGKESGLRDIMLRTDTELLTKKDLKRNTKNLTYFDAVIFASTTGELDIDDSQKQDLMSFIREDGKGLKAFVGLRPSFLPTCALANVRRPVHLFSPDGGTGLRLLRAAAPE